MKKGEETKLLNISASMKEICDDIVRKAEIFRWQMPEKNSPLTPLLVTLDEIKINLGDREYEIKRDSFNGTLASYMNAPNINVLERIGQELDQTVSGIVQKCFCQFPSRQAQLFLKDENIMGMLIELSTNLKEFCKGYTAEFQRNTVHDRIHRFTDHGFVMDNV